MPATYIPVPFKDDDLPIGEIGSWGLDKHKLLAIYAHLFSRSMKNRWPNRVFIDLFAGSGVATVRGTGQIVEASPLIALRTSTPFTHHIFCDADAELLDALKQRVDRLFPDALVDYVHGDVNETVGEIIKRIPPYRTGHGTLSFCFADPFGMKNLNFETIRRLSELFMDFLIHIPTAQAQRFAEAKYLESELGTAPPDGFLGSTEWRDRIRVKPPRQSIDMFFTEIYSERMLECGRTFGGAEYAPLIQNKEDRNQRLYRLAFFSNHQLGEKFWEEVLRAWHDPTLF